MANDSFEFQMSSCWGNARNGIVDDVHPNIESVKRFISLRNTKCHMIWWIYIRLNEVDQFETAKMVKMGMTQHLRIHILHYLLFLLSSLDTALISKWSFEFFLFERGKIMKITKTSEDKNEKNCFLSKCVLWTSITNASIRMLQEKEPKIMKKNDVTSHVIKRFV